MATTEKTYLFSEKFVNIKYKKLGRTAWQASICGFGTYRVDYRISQHSEALEYAIKNGINLIDTSSNYSDGGSEILIGNVINDLVGKNQLDRDEMILITKGGYIQGHNLTIAAEKTAAGDPYPEVVKCAPDLLHCIHPEFLKDQITQSLSNMKQEYIDIFLLHNPEYYLNYTALRNTEELRKEYYRRIKAAFEYLEGEVELGRIRYYGISSNTFGEEDSKRSFTSLAQVIELAREISPDNHFAVAEFPLNLVEKECVQVRSGANNNMTVLELCSRNNIGILINRPLNAIKDNKIIRLADYYIKEDRSMPEITVMLSELKKQEETIKADYINELEIKKDEKNNILESISLAPVLQNVIDKFESVNQFIEIKKQFFVPRANFAINEIYKHYPEEQELVSRLNYYATTVNIVLDSMESIYARESNVKNRKYHELLSEYMNGDEKELSLSQKAILMINSIPEVNCTLVGMRNKYYVNDVIGSIEAAPLARAMEFWSA